MNAKAKGTRNEHRSRAILEAAGYRITRAALVDFAVPPHCCKLIHRWRDRQRLPDIQVL
jgi:hypothetical protein